MVATIHPIQKQARTSHKVPDERAKRRLLQALYREDIGYIDIVWGENDKNNKGFGLKHIIEKHGKEIEQLGFKVEVFIPIIVQFGELKKSKKEDKILLEGEMFRVVIYADSKKKFVLTAFDLRPLSKKKKSKGNQ